jgi:hypothetical protein
MRYALPAFVFFALVAAGAAYDVRTPRRTAVPAIELRPTPAREVKAVTRPKRVQRVKRVQHVKKPRIAKGSSARARLSSGHGGAGAAPAPPSPGLPAGDDSDDDDHGDNDD